METTGHNSALFLASGCLTAEGLREYCSGQLNPVDHQISDNHIANCSFCSEAINGHTIFLESFSADELKETHDDLLNQIDVLINKNRPAQNAEKKNKINTVMLTWLSIAAAVIVFFGIYYTYSHHYSGKNNDDLALADNRQPNQKSENSSNLSAPPVGNPTKANGESEPYNTVSAKPGPEKKTAEGESKQEATASVTTPTTITNSAEIKENSNENAAIAAKKETQVEPSATKVAVSANKRSMRRSDEDAIESNNQTIYTSVEEMPSFPGGEASRLKFLQGNTIFPQSAKEKGISGTVYVSFLVESTGKISDIKVLKGIGSGCDEEAIRVVRKMPNWIPGKQAGKPVGVKFTMPIKFSQK